MFIRAAVPGDAEALTDLHLDVWEEAYSHLIPEETLQERRTTRPQRIARWTTDIQSAEGQTLLACNDDEPRLVGFVRTGPGRDEPRSSLPEHEVWALYVRAEVYGCGVGHALMREATGTAAAYLWVLDGNDRAIHFYERQGFRFDGSTKEEPDGVEHRMVRRM